MLPEYIVEGLKASNRQAFGWYAVVQKTNANGWKVFNCIQWQWKEIQNILRLLMLDGEFKCIILCICQTLLTCWIFYPNKISIEGHEEVNMDLISCIQKMK